MKRSSKKSFGILFFIVFLFVGIWPLLNFNSGIVLNFNSGTVRIWSIAVSFIFLAIAFIKQELLKPLNSAWIKVGEILGKIISPIVMVVIFFFIVTPLSFIIRLFGKDLLKLKISKDNSYWIAREKNINPMDKQF